MGPLGRLNAAKAMATGRAEIERQRLFEALGWPAHQTLAFHWARLVEALQAAETVELLARDPDLGSRDVRAVPAPLPGPRDGVGAVEAPRGTLIHHYAADRDGILTRAAALPIARLGAALRTLEHAGRIERKRGLWWPR